MITLGGGLTYAHSQSHLIVETGVCQVKFSTLIESIEQFLVEGISTQVTKTD